MKKYTISEIGALVFVGLIVGLLTPSTEDPDVSVVLHRMIRSIVIITLFSEAGRFFIAVSNGLYNVARKRIVVMLLWAVTAVIIAACGLTTSVGSLLMLTAIMATAITVRCNWAGEQVLRELGSCVIESANTWIKEWTYLIAPLGVAVYSLSVSHGSDPLMAAWILAAAAIIILFGNTKFDRWHLSN